MYMWDTLDKLRIQLQNLQNKLIVVLYTAQYWARWGFVFQLHFYKTRVQKLPGWMTKECSLQTKNNFNKRSVFFFFVLYAPVRSQLSSMVDFIPSGQVSSLVHRTCAVCITYVWRWMKITTLRALSFAGYPSTLSCVRTLPHSHVSQRAHCTFRVQCLLPPLRAWDTFEWHCFQQSDEALATPGLTQRTKHTLYDRPHRQRENNLSSIKDCAKDTSSQTTSYSWIYC